jgi:hypothetical protein
MNKAFEIIKGEDRLVDTPFAFGGNMVISRDCWIRVPFDPLIARGEDMDYLRNVRYFGFDVKLDRSLSIVHLPPKSQTPYTVKFEQDVYRFFYAKYKLSKLGIAPNLYDPYPGFFLKQTEGKFLLTELLHYIFHNQNDLASVEDPQELFQRLHTMPTIFNEAKTYAKANSDFYIGFQKKWEELMQSIPVEIPFEFIREI